MNKNFAFSLSPQAKRLTRATLIALSLGGVVNAHAALFGDDEARNAIIDLRTKTQSDNQVLRNSILELQRQIDALRQELAQNRGKTETLESDLLNLTKNVNNTNQRIQTAEQRVQTNEQRLQKFEPVSVELDGEMVMVDPRERQAYDAIMARLDKSEYGPADIDLDAFMAKYPDSPYRASALYWSGNSKFALKNYPKSIETFRKLLTLNPQNVHASEAMLAIANAQVQLKDKKSAKKTLEDLTATYPDTPSAEKAKELIPLMK